MKKLVAVLGIIFAASGNCAVIPESGDIVQIGDFQFVVLSVSDFERMKVTVDDLKAKWAMMNSNETGRAALHGRRGHATITNGTIQVEYADGYRHIETIKENKIDRNALRSRPIRAEKKEAAARALTPWEIRREAIVRARKEALSKTNEVSVTIER